MKTTEAIKSFDGVANLAKALGITTAAIYQWGEEVPPLRDYQIRELLSAPPAPPYTGTERRQDNEPGHVMPLQRSTNHKEAA